MGIGTADYSSNSSNMWWVLIYLVTLMQNITKCQDKMPKSAFQNDFLFDFTTMSDVNDWYEVSDTVREVGKSKATLVLQKTRKFQRAIFFTLLNPQPNGACFAGVNYDGNFDLGNYSGLEIRFKAQAADIKSWKIVLKTSASVDRFTTYQQDFEASKTNEDFEIVKLDLKDFHQTINGTINPNEVPLDKSDIRTFGFQVFGGVYDDFKQSGPGTLEIDYVKLTR